MCNTLRYSESGACLGVQRCNEFVLVQSDRDRLAGVVQGMEEQNARNLEALRRAEAENARLREALESVEWVDIYGPAVHHCPSCGRTDMSGHDEDCKLANALKGWG